MTCKRIYASKGPKKQRKLGLLPDVRMANNGFHGVILGMLAKVAATKGMFDGITDAASMDSEMGLPVLLATVLPWINVNAFILFFIYFLPPIVV
jgi:SSS family solute:Na+ symporter